MTKMNSALVRFEQEFAAWLGARGAVATGFGRSALYLALEALDVRGGDVVVPNFICAQVPEAVRRAGARPIFYPVQRDLSIRAADFLGALTGETRAALVAHYFGRVLPEVADLVAPCRERSVPLIEDCALAFGAGDGAYRAGTYGDLAIFSFTKSDWCYGGGIVVATTTDLLERLRALRSEKLRPARRLALAYGSLRRADFAANRPHWCRIAEFGGRIFQRVSGLGDANFYDAGRFDALMPEFAARRATRLLKNLERDTRLRNTRIQALIEKLGGASGILARAVLRAGDSGAFLLLHCPDDRAAEWIACADRAGVTLRRCWPAYQAIDPQQGSDELAWLADHLLLLEVHPRWAITEVDHIAQTLRRLAQEN